MHRSKEGDCGVQSAGCRRGGGGGGECEECGGASAEPGVGARLLVGQSASSLGLHISDAHGHASLRSVGDQAQEE
eukprot:4549837-Prymnesium_polylepis.1